MAEPSADGFFWAKTDSDGCPATSVRQHCLNVGNVAQELISRLPWALRNLLPSGVTSLAALHDIGKISPGFASKCTKWLTQQGFDKIAAKEDWINQQSDHARISQWVVQTLLSNGKLDPWAAAVGAHHGRIKGRTLTRFKVGRIGDGSWEEARRNLIKHLIDCFGRLPEEAPHDESLLWYVAGLITVADWIGSDERFFNSAGHFKEPPIARARVALDSIGWLPVDFLGNKEFNQLFPACTQPLPTQAAMMDNAGVAGLFILEAPMGGGKTEAALAAAYQLISSRQASGLYFALPTQITSNRIFERVAAFINRADTEPSTGRLRLAHSASWLYEDEPALALRPAFQGDESAGDSTDIGRSWFISSKRALLTPYGVGTIDQALLGVVAAKHFFVRLFGLAGKVVVLDEVHTYDLYTGTLLDILVERLRKLCCTVIILSATLTKERRRSLLGSVCSNVSDLSDAYPLLTVSSATEELRQIAVSESSGRQVHVSVFTRPQVELADQALTQAERGECVLWVRNTVREAQETFRLLRSVNWEQGPELALLHSRFPFFRREQLEAKWLERLGKSSPNRPKGCVLVATQVVEQSVDIDADYLISDLAPTDMLLQRVGRLWRHLRVDRPCAMAELQIALPESLVSTDVLTVDGKTLKTALGLSALVYSPYVLLQSLKQWQQIETLLLPDDIRALVEATYVDRQQEPPGWQDLRRELEDQKATLRQLALNNTNIWLQPALPDEEGVQTRISTRPTVQLVLVQEVIQTKARMTRVQTLNGEIVELRERKWSFEAAKAIHRNLVRIPRYAAAESMQVAPSWLQQHVYGPCALGIVRAGDIYWTGNDTPSGLTWHPDEGVFIPKPENLNTIRERDDIDHESFE
jgi:CRISPR-associated endonuclease/helicase Cas3